MAFVPSEYGSILVIQITLAKSSNGGVVGYSLLEVAQVSMTSNGGAASFLLS